MAGVRILEYLDPSGSSPWAQWHRSLDAEAKAKVTVVLYRMAEGNFSNVKGVGGGVFERVLDWDDYRQRKTGRKPWH